MHGIVQPHNKLEKVWKSQNHVKTIAAPGSTTLNYSSGRGHYAVGPDQTSKGGGVH